MIDIEFARRLRALKIEGYSFREIAHYYGTNHVRVARNIKRLDLLEPIPIPLPHVVDTYAYIFLLKSREHLLKERIDIFLSKGVKRENIYVDIVERDITNEDIFDIGLVKNVGDKPISKKDKGGFGASINMASRPNMMFLITQKLGVGDVLWIYDWSEIVNNFFFFEILFISLKQKGVKVEVITGITDRMMVRVKIIPIQG